MKIAIVTLTKGASELGRQLRDRIGGTLYCKAEYCIDEQEKPTAKPFKDFAAGLFESYDALIFIMATGIVVRSLASCIESKTSDPAVVVMDEAGNHAISLLSGHLGGGNALAHEVGQAIGASPVITTASDVTGNLAVDMLAQKLGLAIGSMENAKDVTAKGINGGSIHIFTATEIPKEIENRFPSNVKVHNQPSMDQVSGQFKTFQREDEKLEDGAIYITSNILELSSHAVQLIPRHFVVGIGCRRDSKAQVIEEVFMEACKKAGLHYKAIRALSTIQLKSDEEGILKLVDKLKVPLKIIDLKDIKSVQSQFKGSDFVEKTIGVRAVAEPCAMLAAEHGTMKLHRYADQGVTIAIWEEDYAINR